MAEKVVLREGKEEEDREWDWLVGLTVKAGSMSWCAAKSTVGSCKRWAKGLPVLLAEQIGVVVGSDAQGVHVKALKARKQTRLTRTPTDTIERRLERPSVEVKVKVEVEVEPESEPAPALELELELELEVASGGPCIDCP